MIVLTNLTEEQKKEIDDLFEKMKGMDKLPFQIISKPPSKEFPSGYLAIASDNPYVVKALVLEAFVSLIKRGKDK